MKKIYHFLAAFLLFAGVSQAQKLDFGVKGGLNYSNNIGSRNDNSKRLLSFHAGLFSEIAISDRFSLQPELLYSAQGRTIDVTVNSFDVLDPSTNIPFGGTYKLTSKQNYLNIPVLAKYYITNLFSLEAGPQVGFHINSIDKAKANDGSTVKESNSGDFKLDYGATLGLGLRPLNNIRLQLRYYLGFKNLLSGSRLTNDTSFHSVFQLSAGYVIF